MNEKTPKKISAYQLFLSAFGMGFMPFAPGTWGSAWCALIFFIAAMACAGTMAVNITLAILFIYGFWATIYFGDKGIEHYGDDPGMIVSDEVCGQAVAFFWLHQWADFSAAKIAVYCFAGFVLFRIFDIVKPWPACYFDSLKNKWGVLFDDIAAGVYAGIILQILFNLQYFKAL